jgi:hypothetical protein
MEPCALCKLQPLYFEIHEGPNKFDIGRHHASINCASGRMTK